MLAAVDTKELAARRLVRQRDVDAFLEATAHGRVERPREVGGRQYQDAVVVIADAVELDQELSLHAGGKLVGAVTGAAAFAVGAQRVDLVDEDYGGFLFARELEKTADEAVLN